MNVLQLVHGISSVTARSGEWVVVGISFQKFCFLSPSLKFRKSGKGFFWISFFSHFPIPRGASRSWSKLESGTRSTFLFRSQNAFQSLRHVSLIMICGEPLLNLAAQIWLIVVEDFPIKELDLSSGNARNWS